MFRKKLNFSFIIYLGRSISIEQKGHTVVLDYLLFLFRSMLVRCFTMSVLFTNNFEIQYGWPSEILKYLCTRVIIEWDNDFENL